MLFATLQLMMQFDCELSMSAHIAKTTQTFVVYDRFVVYLDVMSRGWTIATLC